MATSFDEGVHNYTCQLTRNYQSLKNLISTTILFYLLSDSSFCLFMFECALNNVVFKQEINKRSPGKAVAPQRANEIFYQINNTYHVEHF